jgi:hypothetical protein
MAFYQEHERCGELEEGIEGPRLDDVYVRAGIVRALEPAARD